MSYQVGDIVMSIVGHDKYRLYVVIANEQNRLLLSDGYYSIILHWKMKNPKHVKFVKHCSGLAQLIAKNKIFNCHIRYELSKCDSHTI